MSLQSIAPEPSPRRRWSRWLVNCGVVGLSATAAIVTPLWAAGIAWGAWRLGSWAVTSLFAGF